MGKIRIGIIGYGNLGKGVESSVRQNEDMELAAVFTNLDPSTISLRTPNVPVMDVKEAGAMKGKIDVMILCCGSAVDMPVQGPVSAAAFNTVDCYDTHAKIPEYFKNMDASSKSGGNVSVISIGWDPGVFSLAKAYGDAFLPQGKTYTFWGKGVSQGHSEAVRRMDGVKHAVQYTVPYEKALQSVRNGENPELKSGDCMWRECFVVLEEGADAKKIERDIKTMPDYFAGYNTEVHFITEEEFKASHTAMPHGGFVLRSGVTGIEKPNRQTIEYGLKLESNPEFTASVAVAYARAAYRLNRAGETGARTIFDIPPALLSNKTREEMIREFL